MKIAALDLGDRWVGVALSDSIGMIAAPYTTVENNELIKFLQMFLEKEPIETIVIGYPLTMRGTDSQQTLKVKKQKEELEKMFTVKFILWDERLSSKRATELKIAKTKEEKIKTHARAAAFILESYLLSRSFSY